ncbi:MAG: 1,4-dihydroxy-2-naphthoate octaprenyltransferase [Prevotella sp.]|nr:1,4-dihydroxy-2-naphthoate octaprenyltransferase [Prevotella sp.]
MEDIVLNSPKAWFLAARPKTLAGAAVPVMIALAMSWRFDSGRFAWLPALLCLFFAFIMQIDANFVNDYFDCLHGNDDDTRLGPQRACAQGWVSMQAMKAAICLTSLTACAVGFPLIFYGGWSMLLVGAACVLFCFLYTTTLSYYGLGDLLVLVFFGIVPVCATFFIQHHCLTVEVFVASVACGIAIDALLIVNNYRDIANDARAGKRTLIVMVGDRRGRRLYLLSGITALLLCTVHVFSGHPWAFLLPLLAYLPLHLSAYRQLCAIGEGRALNKVLGLTARNIFVYGLSVAVGSLV